MGSPPPPQLPQAKILCKRSTQAQFFIHNSLCDQRML